MSLKTMPFVHVGLEAARSTPIRQTLERKLSHSRKIIFQMAEVAVPRELFRDIMKAIERLKLATVLSG